MGGGGQRFTTIRVDPLLAKTTHFKAAPINVYSKGGPGAGVNVRVCFVNINGEVKVFFFNNFVESISCKFFFAHLIFEINKSQFLFNNLVNSCLQFLDVDSVIGSVLHWFPSTLRSSAQRLHPSRLCALSGICVLQNEVLSTCPLQSHPADTAGANQRQQ